MIYLIAKTLERATKDLIQRLKNDYNFSFDCGFLFSYTIPSESSYSCMVTGLK